MVFDSEIEGYLSNIEELPMPKMPLCVICCCLMADEHSGAKRLKQAITYLNEVIKSDSGLSQSMFYTTEYLLKNRADPFAILTSVEPSTPVELFPILQEGADSAKRLIETGQLVKNEVETYFSHLYQLCYQTLLPESKNPEKHVGVDLVLEICSKIKNYLNDLDCQKNGDEDENEQNVISQSLMSIINEGINEAVDSKESGVDPFSPFAILVDDNGQKALARLKGLNTEESIEMGPALVQQKKSSTTAFAIFWDGYLTLEGERNEAIWVKAGEKGNDQGYLLALRYKMDSDGQFHDIGNILVLDKFSNLLN